MCVYTSILIRNTCIRTYVHIRINIMVTQTTYVDAKSGLAKINIPAMYYASILTCIKPSLKSIYAEITKLAV